VILLWVDVRANMSSWGRRLSEQSSACHWTSLGRHIKLETFPSNSNEQKQPCEQGEYQSSLIMPTRVHGKSWALAGSSEDPCSVGGGLVDREQTTLQRPKQVEMQHVEYGVVLSADATRPELGVKGWRREEGRIRTYQTRRQGDRKVGCAVARYRNMAFTDPGWQAVHGTFNILP